MNMKKMATSEMRHVNGGSFLGAAILGWAIGRTAVCGFKGLFKC